jgi:hypothetical protein
LAEGILGSAQSYSVLGATGVTNTGPTTINGNLGSSPNNSITGDESIFVGASAIDNVDAMQAQLDETFGTIHLPPFRSIRI